MATHTGNRKYILPTIGSDKRKRRKNGTDFEYSGTEDWEDVVTPRSSGGMLHKKNLPTMKQSLRETIQIRPTECTPSMVRSTRLVSEMIPLIMANWPN